MKKIKRVSFKVFSNLKELLKNFKQKTKKAQLRAKNLRPKAPKKLDLKPRIQNMGKKLKLCPQKNQLNQQYSFSIYEPSPIYQTQNSSFWRWQRVKEWFQYINDPYEKIKNKNEHIMTKMV